MKKILEKKEKEQKGKEGIDGRKSNGNEDIRGKKLETKEMVIKSVCLYRY